MIPQVDRHLGTVTNAVYMTWVKAQACHQLTQVLSEARTRPPKASTKTANYVYYSYHARHAKNAREEDAHPRHPLEHCSTIRRCFGIQHLPAAIL